MKSLTLFLALIFSSYCLAAQDKVFFTNQLQTTVASTDLDGGNYNLIAQEQITLRRIRVDQKNGKVYWVEGATGNLWFSDLDGTNVAVFLTLSNNLAVIEIDTLNNRILFTESGENTIQSVDLDGQNIQTLISDTGFVLGIDYDPIQNFIYWTDFNNGLIKRANGDGTNSIVLASSLGLPFGLVLDTGNQVIYYSDRQTFRIYKIAISDGAFLGAVTQPGSSFIGDLCIDKVNSRIYWIEGEPHIIKSADLDGNNISLTILSDSPFAGIDVVPSPLPSATTTPVSQTYIHLSPNPSFGQFTIAINNKYKS
jgi:DNA-binding beta-propeller fold protein YncE